MTARRVAVSRLGHPRAHLATGDPDSEVRLGRSLGPVWLLQGGSEWRRRVARRTDYVDAAVLGAVTTDPPLQVLLVGAGYDGRALRFGGGGARFFEVDHPVTQQDKRARLLAVGAPIDAATFVPIDLATGDLGAELAAAGHEPDRPSLFVVEGLLGYLPPDAGRALLTTLRSRAAPGSALVGTAVLPPLRETVGERLRHQVRLGLSRVAGERWLARFTDESLDHLLRSSGWTPTEVQRGPSGALFTVVPTV
jgi:methyltransferase (TIGR00027 family)